MKRLLTRLALGITVMATAAGLLVAGGSSPDRVDLDVTADLGQFNPGNIISDSVFFDGAGMSPDDVRKFIELKGMNCRAGSDGTPCLKDYRQDTTARPADQYCSGYAAGSQESAATIISKAARACNVSPRVLLVMLQKEQSLVTNTGSSLYERRYREAMGYACPDTAPCDPAYNGFQNQVYSAARRFQVYKVHPTSYGYRAGRTNTVLYHPNRDCGSSQVYIHNQATAGLYIYTPYQPNAAALAAGYGSGDACSAYGNRNFWLYFTDWFTSTQAPGESAWQPLGALDSVTARTGNQVDIRGWAVDPDTTAPISVHVYVDGQLQGSVTADARRDDVAAALPAWGGAHGYERTIGVTQGIHEVCVYAINVGAFAPNTKLGCRTVDTRGLPLGSIDAAVLREGQGELTGWALDPDSSSPTAVHVYVNGAWATQALADQPRPDVAEAYPAAGTARGFRIPVPLQPGRNEVCLFAINSPSGGHNPQLGCWTTTLEVRPAGRADVSGGPRAISVSGWALDPETAGPVDVHVYVDGQWAAALRADQHRDDIPAEFADLGRRHGFSGDVAVAPGEHEVCTYAINVRQGTENPQLGCSTALVGVPPIGNLEVASAEGATVALRGWALDPDTSAPIDVHLYVDGRMVSHVTADAPRPDVEAAHPGTGSAHGFATTVVLAPGRHEACAYAINVLGGSAPNTRLGCLAVTVAPSVEPRGAVDAVTAEAGHLVVRGWAYDPDLPARSIDVHFYLDGRYAGRLTADQSRPDVAAAISGAGEAHGYTAYLGPLSGRRTVCAYAIDTAGAVNPLLGCATLTVTG
ncbi:hypothetical protein ACI792_12330 [Blastococcus sp. SYSU DS0669]